MYRKRCGHICIMSLDGCLKPHFVMKKDEIMPTTLLEEISLFFITNYPFSLLSGSYIDVHVVGILVFIIWHHEDNNNSIING